MELKMSLKNKPPHQLQKTQRTHSNWCGSGGQSLIEYVLLVAITLTTLLTTLLTLRFIISPRNNAFEDHFTNLSYYMGSGGLD
jgi:hypothetical protein